MGGKRGRQIEHYQGIRTAMLDHIQHTESGLSGLTGIDPKDQDRLIAAVRKRHDTLLRKIERTIETLTTH